MTATHEPLLTSSDELIPVADYLAISDGNDGAEEEQLLERNQIPFAVELIDGFGLPTFMHDGFEYVGVSGIKAFLRNRIQPFVAGATH